MPYNAAPIPLENEPTGTTQLPFARVKRIINIDQDVNTCSNQAAFVITLATEMFIQYLAEAGHNVVKSERKPRRNIQYRDLAGAVSRLDNLEFLSDIIPKTVPYSEVKTKKAPAGLNPANSDVTGNGVAAGAGASSEGTQTTLDGARPAAALNGSGAANGATGGVNGGTKVDALDEDEDPNSQLTREMQMRGGRSSIGSTGGTVNGKEDVEMS